ncbi:hypothetical protein [Paenibacillus sp. NPDC057934]|uniref:hypothetical protein n=1 Tax=Paenibacillus sp. NPDC057934 TaxID=3346282 RepID=UPI0036DBD13E
MDDQWLYCRSLGLGDPFLIGGIVAILAYSSRYVRRSKGWNEARALYRPRIWHLSFKELLLG